MDLRTGWMQLVNAGHVALYVARRSDVSVLDLPADLPLGLFAETSYREARLTLRPGDRVVLVTDGMLERNPAGIGLPTAIADTCPLHPREVVRALADSALEATGHALSDDATVLCLDWHGAHDEERPPSLALTPDARARLCADLDGDGRPVAGDRQATGTGSIGTSSLRAFTTSTATANPAANNTAPQKNATWYPWMNANGARRWASSGLRAFSVR